jgi:hypothetical protein
LTSRIQCQSRKRAYDDFNQERQGTGVVGDPLFQSAGDPNDVTVWHDFETLEAGQGFVESERLREVMAAAGAAGAHQIWFTTPA